MREKQRKLKKQSKRDWHTDREDEWYKDTSTEGDREMHTWREKERE